jgi:Holliday junction resolvase
MKRRNRAPGAGNARELKVMAVLAEEGWLCASRRHIGGAGDVLAIKAKRWTRFEVPNPHMLDQAMLIEVKSTTRNPWNDFGPADRQALVETAEKHGAEAWLYWWPPRKPLQRIHSSEFPRARPQIELPTLEEARAEHARAVIERQDSA